MSEVDKLWQYCQDNNVKHLGVTTAYELGLSDKKPTVEEIAKAINDTHEWLADPVNNLVSKIGGHIFLKKDTIMCMEHRKRVIAEEPYFEEVPLTQEEKYELRRLKEDVELFEAAIEMIKELNSKCQK